MMRRRHYLRCLRVNIVELRAPRADADVALFRCLMMPSSARCGYSEGCCRIRIDAAAVMRIVEEARRCDAATDFFRCFTRTLCRHAAADYDAIRALRRYCRRAIASRRFRHITPLPVTVSARFAATMCAPPVQSCRHFR